MRPHHCPHAPSLAVPVIALALCGGTALGQFTFAPAANVAAGIQPSGVAAGDFDGDGDVDLATTVGGPDRVIVLLNDGSGGYAAGPSSPLPASSSPQDVIAGLFNGDTIMDLAVAVRDPAGSVIVMAGNGAGTFTTITTIAVGDRPRGLSAGDLEPDGDLDLAVANRNDGTASVAVNDGTGAFTVSTLVIGGEPRATAMGDLDGDDDLDVVVTDGDGRSIELFANNGGGSFAPAGSLLVNPNVRPDGVTAVDIDGDGDCDVIAATSDATLGINQAAVFLSGVAGFTGPAGYDTGGINTSGIVAADLDCDGLPDLATTNQDSNDVSLLRNVGGGAFGGPMILAAGTRPNEVLAADFDGDGDPDIAVANRDSGDVSVLIDDTCAPCPWDVDGDGSVNVGDLLAMLAAWGPNPGHAADFDGDGAVGVTDLLALLAHWGPCL